MRSSDANRRFTAWQVINLAPTLMVDSVRDPIGAPHMARSLSVAIADTSRTNSVEAIKAMRSVILEGLTGQEREEIGARLVFEAFKVGWVMLISRVFRWRMTFRVYPRQG
jgi:transcriptional regulator NrdR family protein